MASTPSPLPLVGRDPIADGLMRFRFKGFAAGFEPGQDIKLAVPTGGDSMVNRPYAIASAPGEPLELQVVRVPGKGLTPRLFAPPIGATSCSPGSRPRGRQREGRCTASRTGSRSIRASRLLAHEDPTLLGIGHGGLPAVRAG